jgi:AcrR family transcriptional regulator
VPKARRTRTLTLDSIVEESLSLVRRLGVGGLTMRAVAAELGVTPMAVYYYVADKDDLLRLVVDRVTASSGVLQRRPEETWQDSLRNYLMSMWENSRNYPGLSSHMINLPGLGLTPERMDAGLGFFESVGFPLAQARLAYSFAITYVHGRLSVDAHLSHRADAPHLDGAKAGDYVTFGVDAVIHGLEARLAELLAAEPRRGASTAGLPS